MEILERKKTLLEYFNGDSLAANVWKDKYAMKGEETPDDMHWRIAKEFGRIEEKFISYGCSLDNVKGLSTDNIMLILGADKIYEYFKDFKYIVPQGSIMAMLGNITKIGSLSNCFVIPSPPDSYGGIMKTDERIVQLMKRRGGVGFDISTLRPNDTPVTNAAGTSTGATSFMHRYSNSTREVAQNGRRGALMLLIDCRHPEVFDFVKIKDNKDKVTGANISVMLTDRFMQQVEKDGDFICRFPVEQDIDRFFNMKVAKTSVAYKLLPEFDLEYNKLTEYGEKGNYFMKIRAKELFDLIVEMAWKNAEPGIAFIDRIQSYAPDGVYEQYKPTACNPCGEIWMQPYDACRLLAINLFSIVERPFTKESVIDYDKLYEIAYIQQRLADDIVELELENIEKIISKIKSDPEPDDIKATELELWNNVYATTKASRRTGCGLTGLGDMIAALGLSYDSDEALKVIEEVMKTKMRAELDCTIDLAILRGTFEGWDKDLEFHDVAYDGLNGKNEFYKMLTKEFPDQVHRMYKWGRRNISFSTVAPTGTVSVLTQTSSGLEPLFEGFYMRRVKIVDSQEADFVDQNGDKWREYPILHPKFKDWITFMYKGIHNPEKSGKEALNRMFELSPWFKSTANDISWEKRIKIQAVIQKYTTNAISSTLNLPNNVEKEVVAGIYKEAWKNGLKGVTIYRDGCRTGVLVKEKSSFEYRDAVKRPKELEADLHIVTAKGKKYAVIVGLFEDKPYELFAFEAEEDLTNIKVLKGKVVKVKKGRYDFLNGEEDHTIKNLQIIAETGEEQILTRLVSGMLRHGAKPQFCMEQIDKCDLGVVSFSKSLSRVLKKYITEEEMVSRNKCSNCGSTNLKMQEGCMSCADCGHSKC